MLDYIVLVRIFSASFQSVKSKIIFKFDAKHRKGREDEKRREVNQVAHIRNQQLQVFICERRHFIWTSRETDCSGIVFEYFTMCNICMVGDAFKRKNRPKRGR